MNFLSVWPTYHLPNSFRVLHQSDVFSRHSFYAGGLTSLLVTSYLLFGVLISIFLWSTVHRVSYLFPCWTSRHASMSMWPNLCSIGGFFSNHCFIDSVKIQWRLNFLAVLGILYYPVHDLSVVAVSVSIWTIFLMNIHPEQANKLFCFRSERLALSKSPAQVIILKSQSNC